MIYDAVARHKSGAVLALKSFRKTIKTQQITSMQAGKKTRRKAKAAENVDGEGRFPTLKEAELQHIEEALLRAGGNQGTAAALLGISRPALNRRLARMRKN